MSRELSCHALELALATPPAIPITALPDPPYPCRCRRAVSLTAGAEPGADALVFAELAPRSDSRYVRPGC
jgi:hypothetical protein